MAIEAPPPGIHRDVNFTDYLSWKLLSQSVIKKARPPKGSMLAMKWAWDHPLTEPTDPMLLGSALHTAFLEPHYLVDRVVCWKGKTRNGGEWEAFNLEHEGRIILTKGLYEKLQFMLKSMRKSAAIKRWIGRIEDVEVSVVGDIRGVPVKGRIDAQTDDPLLDVKKVSSVDPYMLAKTINDFGLHIQGAIYRDLYNRERYGLMCIESEPPFDCVEVEIPERALDRGWDEAVAIIEQWKQCEKSGKWPGISDEPLEIDLPAWAYESNDEPKVRISA